MRDPAKAGSLFRGGGTRVGTAGWTATVVSCWGAMAEHLAADGKAKGHKGRGRRRKRLPRWADRLITVLIILVGAGLLVWP